MTEPSPRLNGLLLSIAAQRADGEEEAHLAYTAALRRLAWRKGRGFKVCDRCKRPLKPSEFGRRSRSADGLDRSCLPCERRRKRHH